MSLDAPGLLSDTDCLVGAEQAGGQEPGWVGWIGGQLDSFAVQLENRQHRGGSGLQRREAVIDVGKKFIFPALGGKGHGEGMPVGSDDPGFPDGVDVDLPPGGLYQELHAQADAQVGDPGSQQLGNEIQLGEYCRCGVVGAGRPAEDHHRLEALDRRQGLSGFQVDDPVGDGTRNQDFLKEAGAFDCRVLDEKYTTLGIGSDFWGLGFHVLSILARPFANCKCD